MRVGIIYGGKSAEHDISILSARSIYNAINKKKYTLNFLKIAKNGQWIFLSEAQFIKSDFSKYTVETNNNNTVIFTSEKNREISSIDMLQIKNEIDVAFLALHGPMGEDGTVQGLMKLANIPFVGSSVLGSAIGMDKDIAKRLLRDSNIPIGKFITLYSEEKIPHFAQITKTLGIPFFVKPANMGSSVGVTKVHREHEFSHAIQKAFSYDTKILVEECIFGRELECAIIGNRKLRASVIGEINTNDDFYSYNAKYSHAHATTLEIPACISDTISRHAQNLAIQTYKALTAEGLARVDMFLKDSGDIVINEINTLPGFTENSMYPKLWEASGLSYELLIDTLIQLARERHSTEQAIKTSNC